MTTREMSESNENFEKDLTLNAEAAQEAATTAQENTPAAETEEVVDKQVENTAMAQEESCAEHQEDAQAEQVEASEAVQMPVESQAESKQEDSDVMEELPNIDYSTLDKGQLVEELEKLLQQPVEIVLFPVGCQVFPVRAISPVPHVAEAQVIIPGRPGIYPRIRQV